MKAIRVIVALVTVAILAGCVVYPIGYGGGGGYRGGGHHHGGGYYHGGGNYRR